MPNRFRLASMYTVRSGMVRSSTPLLHSLNRLHLFLISFHLNLLNIKKSEYFILKERTYKEKRKRRYLHSLLSLLFLILFLEIFSCQVSIYLHLQVYSSIFYYRWVRAVDEFLGILQSSKLMQKQKEVGSELFSIVLSWNR